MYKPLIGITMGDPASIGPEISVMALTDERLLSLCRPVIVGDAAVMEDAVKVVCPGKVSVRPIGKVSEASFEDGVINVLDMGLVDMAQLQYGKVSAMCGEAAFRYVEKVIELAMAGEIDATVTNALNKAAINLAGHKYAGHTEIYAEYTGTRDYTMMLAHDGLRVVHVSTHVSLREACDRVKKERVLKVIGIANEACRSLGIDKPRIAVAGLNPHAGEDGLFGREEIEEISPAIEEAVTMGMDVSGPVPPDTVFSKARGGWYDIVVAMYHDQGHIPLKVSGFVYDKAKGRWDSVAGVNITLGLPIIRVSVDHGTAFGHAHMGLANPLSLKNAIEYAAILSEHKRDT